MKVLPVLDHVLLWVARGFTASLLLFLALGAWLEYTDTDLRMVYETTHDFHDYLYITLDTAYFGVWACIWLICSWHKPTIVTRTILGLSSGIIIAFWILEIFVFNSPIHTSIVLGMRLTIEILAVPVWFALGSLSMAWLALRPPSNASPRNTDNFSAFVQPQSC